MFVGTPLGYILCFWFAVLRPLAQSTRILEDEDRVRRWFAFYVCLNFFVLPLALLLPTWFYFRFELIIMGITCLATSDAEGALSVHECVVVPLLRRIEAYLSESRRAVGSTFSSEDARTPAPPSSPVSEDSKADT